MERFCTNKEFAWMEYQGTYFVFEQRSGNWQIGSDFESIIQGLKNRKEKRNTNTLTVPNDSTFNIVLHITNRCNLTCSYCYASTGISSTKTLSITKIAELINLLNNSEIKHVNFLFHGGEPFIEIELLKTIVALIKQRYTGSYQFFIQTNGTILSESILTYIQKERIHISVSLDGYHQIHDEYRFDANKQGSHERVMANINKMKKNNVPIAINTVLNENCDPNELLKFYLQNDISGFKLEPVRCENSNIEKITELYNFFINELFHNNVNSNVKIQEGRFFSFLHKISGGISPIMCDNFPCGFGTCMWMIDENGDLYPCEEFYGQKDYLLGNLASFACFGEIRDVANKYIIEHASNTKTLCGRCIFRALCAGLCPAQLFRNDVSLCYFRRYSIANYIRLLLENHASIKKLI